MTLSEAPADCLRNNKRVIQKALFVGLFMKFEFLIHSSTELKSQIKFSDLKTPVISSDESATTSQHCSAVLWIVHFQFVLPNRGQKKN